VSLGRMRVTNIGRDAWFKLDGSETSNLEEAHLFGSKDEARTWAEDKLCWRGQWETVEQPKIVLKMPAKGEPWKPAPRPPLNQETAPSLTRSEWQKVVESLHHFAMYGGLEGDRETEDQIHALAERIREVIR
jgi:hypothetical protein